jgi:hypothetical protein
MDHLPSLVSSPDPSPIPLPSMLIGRSRWKKAKCAPLIKFHTALCCSPWFLPFFLCPVCRATYPVALFPTHQMDNSIQVRSFLF